MKTITVTEEFTIPGTDITLEKGDSFEIKEAVIDDLAVRHDLDGLVLTGLRKKGYRAFGIELAVYLMNSASTEGYDAAIELGEGLKQGIDMRSSSFLKTNY